MPDEPDVFFWQMDASMHSGSVDSLRQDISEAHRDQIPVPIALILDLLPLDTDQANEARARGDFEIDGDHFANVAPSELNMEFEDPVLQSFTVKIPATFSGRLEVSPSSLRILFEPLLEVEIERLEELGVGRNSFQLLESVLVTDEYSLSILKEQGSEHRETWIEAQLQRRNEPFTTLNESVVNLSALGQSTDCPDNDPEEPNWYVYRRNGGLCIIHWGTIVIGGQLAYEYRFGPGTREQAQQYLDQFCPDSLC